MFFDWKRDIQPDALIDGDDSCYYDVRGNSYEGKSLKGEADIGVPERWFDHGDSLEEENDLYLIDL